MLPGSRLQTVVPSRGILLAPRGVAPKPRCFSGLQQSTSNEIPWRTLFLNRPTLFRAKYRTVNSIYRVEGSESEPYLVHQRAYLLTDVPIFWSGAGYLLAFSPTLETSSPQQFVYVGLSIWNSLQSIRSTIASDFLVAAAILIVAIAVVDWQTKPFISIGFLYLFPILLIAGFLPRWQITVVALVCAVLQELFSELPSNEAVTRLLMASAGFVATGLFVSEIIRNRQVTLNHLKEVETQIALRKEIEEQLQVLVESSPVAIVTIDSAGAVLLANEASQTLLAPGGAPSWANPSVNFFPPCRVWCKPSIRGDFARNSGVAESEKWRGLSRRHLVLYLITVRGPRLAAIIVDLSEDLRDREDLSLDHLLKNTTILMSAIAHEIRNLSGAVLVVYKNLSRLPGSAEQRKDFRALGTLIEGLGKLSAMELSLAADQHLGAIELSECPGRIADLCWSRLTARLALRLPGVCRTTCR